MPQKAPAGFIARDVSQPVVARNSALHELRQQRFGWQVTETS